MGHHWKYDATLAAGQRHSIQVQTDNPTCDFNVLLLDPSGQVVAADRGPEPGARIVIDTPKEQRAIIVVELMSGSGSFSLQVASQQLPGDTAQPQPAQPQSAQPQPAQPQPKATAPAPTTASPTVPAPASSTAPSTARSRRPRPAADTSGAPAGSYGGSDLPDAEAHALLEAHNRWRARFGVAPLTWSAQLAAHAQEWANELEATGMQMRHRSPNDFGENLYWCSGKAATPDEVVDAWGDEVDLYDYDANNWWPNAGHFSQVVWYSTTEVGGAVVRHNGQELWVCNYNPRGNWTGQRPYEQ